MALNIETRYFTPGEAQCSRCGRVISSMNGVVLDYENYHIECAKKVVRGLLRDIEEFEDEQ